MSKENIYSFEVTKDAELTANFKAVAETFTLKAAANAEEMGTVSVEPQQDSYEAGTEVTVKAEAKEGFRFVNWTKTGTEEEVSTEAAYKFAITENTDLTANFVKEEVPEEIFRVTLKANDNTMGTVTIDSADGSYKKRGKSRSHRSSKRRIPFCKLDRCRRCGSQ